MSNIKRRLLDPMEVLALAGPALLYIVIAVPVTIRRRAAINPDGIIYIRKAQFLLAGHFWQSVSGYWSPGISWCVAILLRLDRRFDPLHAIHAILTCWGLAWVLAACAFLRSMLPGRPTWRLLAGIAIAFAGVRQAVSLITPDLLLGAMLMAYLAVVSMRGLLTTPKIALIAGLCAGIGYLCKSYALPFFCLHFPLTIAWRYFSARTGREWSQNQPSSPSSLQKAVIAFIVGGIGFALPALPWIGIISYKYGHFTISMVYHHNHMNVAEEAMQESLPDFCVVPPDPYLFIWEGLDPGPRSDWSPFASKHNFVLQLKIVRDHAWLIVQNIARFDFLGLVLLGALLALIPFRALLGRGLFSPVPLWLVMTCVVYCAGFLIVAFEVRYIVPILLPLGMTLCLREWGENQQSIAGSGDSLLFKAPPLLMTAAFIVAAFVGMLQYAYDSPARPMFAEVATWLRKNRLANLYSSSDNNRGVNVAYFLNRKMVLIPFGLHIEKIERELSAADCREVLVWIDSRSDTPDSYPRVLTNLLLQTGHWQHALGEKLDSVRRIDVYVRKGFGAGGGSTTGLPPASTIAPSTGPSAG